MSYMLSSSKNSYGSKTPEARQGRGRRLSSSKNSYGSKTDKPNGDTTQELSSSKNSYGSKTSNLLYHIIEILTTIYNMKYTKQNLGFAAGWLVSLEPKGSGFAS